MPTSAPATARARARAEITEEIKQAARRQMAAEGAAALSLRAVARELGMVSSAVYRYFASRDELLTGLIIESYEAVGAASEAAVGSSRRGFEGQWLALAGAIRQWALANPHDYALLYGSPVPGYRAPQDTIPAAARVSLVALDVVREGVIAGEINVDQALPIPRPVHADFARLRELAAPELSDDVLGRALLAWTQIFGSISMELFGHFHRVIEDYDTFFDHQMRRGAHLLVNG